MYIEKEMNTLDEEKVYTVSDIVEKNVEKIERKFDSLRQGKLVTWNWSAFLFSFLWFAYRKMYIESILILLATQAIKVLPIALGIKSILNFILWIGLTLTANKIYMKKVDSILDEANEMNKTEANSFVNKNSGTSILGIILMIILSMVLIGVCMYFDLYPSMQI